MKSYLTIAVGCIFLAIQCLGIALLVIGSKGWFQVFLGLAFSSLVVTFIALAHAIDARQ